MFYRERRHVGHHRIVPSELLHRRAQGGEHHHAAGQHLLQQRVLGVLLLRVGEVGPAVLESTLVHREVIVQARLRVLERIDQGKRVERREELHVERLARDGGAVTVGGAQARLRTDEQTQVGGPLGDDPLFEQDQLFHPLHHRVKHFE